MAEMPEDWRDNDGWERYWRQEVAEAMYGPHFRAVGRGRGATLLREQLSIPVQSAPAGRHSRIPFAGNGHSPEPWLYANWGCECVALDVAPTARAAVDAMRHRGDLLEQFYCDAECCELLETDPGEKYPMSRSDLATARSRLAAEHREGGSVESICADMFEYEPSEPLDAIVSRFAFQRFSPQDRDALARRFARWLAPGGLLVVEGRFLPGGFEDIEERHGIHSRIGGAGFIIHRQETDRLSCQLESATLKAHRETCHGDGCVGHHADRSHLEGLKVVEQQREELHRKNGGLLAAVDLT